VLTSQAWHIGVCLLSLLAGCWIDPEPNLWKLRDGRSPDQELLDTGPDTRPPDGSPPDTKPPLGPVACSTPEKVGNNPPSGAFETALRIDGLVLYAKASGSWQITKRSAQDQPFEDWSTTSVLSGKQDPTFFSIKGIEMAVVAKSPGSGQPRFLELCTFPFNCQRLTVNYKADGKEVAVDMDGASVAVLADGTVLMAHNIAPGGSNSADVYLATLINTSDITQGFETEKLDAVNQPSFTEDDPALSPDGLVLMFGADGEVWVSERPDVSSSFPAPRKLTDVNSTSDDSSPYLAPLSPSGGKPRYELFFSSDRDGSLTVFRSECTR
jgi:hypothetical protein